MRKSNSVIEMKFSPVKRAYFGGTLLSLNYAWGTLGTIFDSAYAADYLNGVQSKVSDEEYATTTKNCEKCVCMPSNSKMVQPIDVGCHRISETP